MNMNDAIKETFDEMMNMSAEDFAEGLKDIAIKGGDLQELHEFEKGLAIMPLLPPTGEVFKIKIAKGVS
ncbi:hypothetical protein [Providencia phage PSTCR6]|nr:hypothetical protein [Providencia phage PSTCR6]